MEVACEDAGSDPCDVAFWRTRAGWIVVRNVRASSLVRRTLVVSNFKWDSTALPHHCRTGIARKSTSSTFRF